MVTEPRQKPGGHFDHYLGADHVWRRTGCEVALSAEDALFMVSSLDNRDKDPLIPRITRLVKDGDILQFGATQVYVMGAPGHTPGCLNYVFSVHHHGKEHKAIMFGGFGVFGPGQYYGTYPETNDYAVEQAGIFAATCVKSWEYCKADGVDIYLNPHPHLCRMLELAAQNSDDPQAENALVIGAEGVRRWIVDRFDDCMRSILKFTDIREEYKGGKQLMLYSIVHAPCGDVRGEVYPYNKTVYERYLGIPYGTAKRFCAPEAYSWQGVRDCLQYGPCAAQPDALGEAEPGHIFKALGSEDCLNLNIWKPHQSEEKKALPVLVYIHGGAFQTGSNQVETRAGDRFIENDEMIFVSVNYRLGVLGFLQLGDEMPPEYQTSGNCGAMDVLLALEWVKENIAAFGGDAQRITVQGISAGAKLIASLLVLPKMQKICHQVMLESGAMQSFRSVETARCAAKEYEQALGIQTEKELLAMPAEKLVLAQAAYCAKPGTTCYFGPVVDEKFFCKVMLEAWETKPGWHGRALLGSAQHEMKKAVWRPDFCSVKKQMLWNLFGDNDAIAENTAAQYAPDYASENECWEAALSDFMYRYYTDKLAGQFAKQKIPVWVYSFAYGMACHGMGFSFMHKEYKKPAFALPEKAWPQAEKLCADMKRAMKNFVLYDDPNGENAQHGVWLPYENGGKMIFDEEPHYCSHPKAIAADFPPWVYQRKARK